MIKSLLIAFSLLAACALNAQERPAPAPADSLTAYAGKYVFPEGTPITQVNIWVDNGILYSESERGKSALKKTTTADVFEVVEFRAVATFKRNSDGKVIGIKIEAGQLVLEGTKTEPASSSTTGTMYLFK